VIKKQKFQHEDFVFLEMNFTFAPRLKNRSKK